MKKAFPITILAILAVALAACVAPPTMPATLLPATTTPSAIVATTAAPTETTVPAATAVPTETPVPTRVGAAGERSIGDLYIPEIGNTGYDVQRYTLKLALDPAVQEIGGLTQIEAVSTLDNLIEISLDFTGFDVQSVTLDDAPCEYSRQSDKLIVDFPAPLARGTAFRLDVAYQGAPVFEPSQYVPFVPSLGLQYPPTDQPKGSLFIVSEPDGAHYVFPCNDHPRDKATYRIELAVPEGLVGAANGKLVDTQTGVANAFPDGRAGDVYVWEENHPMASYLMTAAVGPYERLEASSPNATPLRSYVFSDQKSIFESHQEVIGPALDWMGDLFGPYPFDVFGYAQVQMMGTSLETQTLVLLGINSNESIMVHEMSHMWFGDWVSLDSWQDIWRNEGFATYITMMWEARDNPAALEEQVKQMHTMYEDHPPSDALDNPKPGLMFGVDSYYRGALLVSDLRQAMGDDAFFQGLKTYMQRYGGRTASFDEFKAVMEEAAGQPLDGAFEKYFQ